MPGMRGVRRRTRRRTAVAVGGAAAVAHHAGKKSDQAADEAYEQGSTDAQTQQAPAPAADDTDYMAELEKLGDLHEKGVLTDEEFAAKKKEVLAKM